MGSFVVGVLILLCCVLVLILYIVHMSKHFVNPCFKKCYTNKVRNKLTKEWAFKHLTNCCLHPHCKAVES